MSNLANIAIGLIVVGLLLVRQLRPRPAREASSARLVLILAAAGIFEISRAVGHHRLTAVAVTWLAVSLMAGAVTGAIRAATVRVWREPDGSAWRQATVLTAALWLVSLGAHLAVDTVIDHASRIAALGTSSILLYLAVTLGVQREIVRRRAAPLAPAEGAPSRTGAAGPECDRRLAASDRLPGGKGRPA
jgi:hypothetical protein